MKNTRVIGVDLLRIIAMISVTAIHYFAYSGVCSLDLAELGTMNFLFVKSLQALDVCFINLFVMITGYLMALRKTTYKKLIALWGQIIFVGIILLLVVILIGEPIRKVSLIRCFFPLTSTSYWFIITYFLLYLLIPILNRCLRFYKQALGKVLLGIGFITTIFLALNPFPSVEMFLGPPTSVFWFCYMYLIGAFIRTYGIPLIRRYQWGIIMIISYSLLWMGIAFYNILPYRVELWEANGLFPLLFSVSLFMVLKDVQLHNYYLSKIIMLMSSCALNVYLIQECDLFRSIVWRTFDAKLCVVEGKNLIPTFLCSVASLWFGALVIHQMYKKIIQFLSSRLNK